MNLGEVSMWSWKIHVDICKDEYRLCMDIASTLRQRHRWASLLLQGTLQRQMFANSVSSTCRDSIVSIGDWDGCLPISRRLCVYVIHESNRVGRLHSRFVAFVTDALPTPLHVGCRTPARPFRISTAGCASMMPCLLSPMKQFWGISQFWVHRVPKSNIMTAN